MHSTSPIFHTLHVGKSRMLQGLSGILVRLVCCVFTHLQVVRVRSFFLCIFYCKTNSCSIYANMKFYIASFIYIPLQVVKDVSYKPLHSYSLKNKQVEIKPYASLLHSLEIVSNCIVSPYR